MKPPLRGLTSIAGMPRAGYPIANRVVQVSWASIEPAPGRFDLGPVERGIAQARSRGLRVKLRVQAGFEAPRWVKRAAGTFGYRQGGPRGAMPRWWGGVYQSAYAAMWRQLAAMYDANPTVREVALSRCMTRFAEPLYRAWRDRGNAFAALRAGYTVAADRACQLRMVTADPNAWPHTSTDLALTGAPFLIPAGRVVFPAGTIPDLIAAFRAAAGGRAILEQNQLRDGKTGNGLYAALSRAGLPLTFQSASWRHLQPATVAGLLAALHLGCTVMRARSVELPAGYHHATAAQLAPYAAACT